MASTRKKTIEEIAARLIPQANGCRLWPGARAGKYGYVKYRQRLHYVHRLLYEHYVGPIPAGMELDHAECDNPLCGNWLHLKVVTHQENMARIDRSLFGRHNSEKTHCKRGHPFSGENTRVAPAGKRVCRTCERARQRLAPTQKQLDTLLKLGVDVFPDNRWHASQLIDERRTW